MSSRQESCKLLLCLVHVESYVMEVPRTHTVPYLVCLGGGVESRSEEWGLLPALVPLLKGDTHRKGRGGEGGEGKVKDRM